MKSAAQERPKRQRGKTVYVALSGGVDSAVSALLLLKQGYSVVGVFMKNWSGTELGIEDNCPWIKDQKDAQAVCRKLGIPFKTYNFENEYRTEVIENFYEEYERGNTPNPDILCNTHIKFGHFLSRARADGADYIATGHYAQTHQNRDGTFSLCRAVDTGKDQTYFLYRLTQAQLARALFPIGSLTKTEVRGLARKNKLPVAEKKDSQGVCFIGHIDLRNFLAQRLRATPGPIIDAEHNVVIGRHNGIWHYTLGQRKGIRIGGTGTPYFVARKDISSNALFVVKGKDNPYLLASSVVVTDTHWIANTPQDGQRYKYMIRYRQEPARCTYTSNTLVFDTPVWLPAPGQSAVLIKNNSILGGGIIESIQTESS